MLQVVVAGSESRRCSGAFAPLVEWRYPLTLKRSGGPWRYSWKHLNPERVAGTRRHRLVVAQKRMRPSSRRRQIVAQMVVRREGAGRATKLQHSGSSMSTVNSNERSVERFVRCQWLSPTTLISVHLSRIYSEPGVDQASGLHQQTPGLVLVFLNDADSGPTAPAWPNRCRRAAAAAAPERAS